MEQGAEHYAHRKAESEAMQLDEGNRYVELHAHLVNQPSPCPRRCMGFGEIVRIMGDQLPADAYGSDEWWANDASTEQARAWLAAGWVVDSVDLVGATVEFVRT